MKSSRPVSKTYIVSFDGDPKKEKEFEALLTKQSGVLTWVKYLSLKYFTRFEFGSITLPERNNES